MAQQPLHSQLDSSPYLRRSKLLSPFQVREKLEEALRSGRKRRGSLAREFIDYIIQRVLTPQRLKEAIEGDLDLTFQFPLLGSST